MTKVDNITLASRMRQDIELLWKIESLRKPDSGGGVFLTSFRMGFIKAISELLDRLFSDLQGWEMEIPDDVLENIHYPIVLKEYK